MSDREEQAAGGDDAASALEAAVEDFMADDEAPQDDGGEKPEHEEDEVASEDDASEDAEDREEKSADDDDDGGEEEDGAAEEPRAIPDDAVVDVNGEKVAIAELKNGYMRAADYTRKTQEVGEVRRALAEQAERINGVIERLVNGIDALLPPPPDESLLREGRTDEYLLQQRRHEEAVARLQELLSEPAQVAQETMQQMSEQEHAEYLAQQRDLLRTWFPETATEEGMRAFAEELVAAGREFGFSDDELASLTDARMARVLKLAADAVKMQKARKAARKKVKPAEKAPVKGPRKAPKRRIPFGETNIPMDELARSLSEDDVIF